MALLDVLHFIRELFADAPCEGCKARDNTITILKEQLYQHKGKIDELEMRIDNINMDTRRRLDFATGMNRMPIQAVESPSLHSVPRNSGIAGRIARAEAADRAEAATISAQRKREYDDRISSLVTLKPEIEVEDGEKENTEASS